MQLPSFKTFSTPVLSIFCVWHTKCHGLALLSITYQNKKNKNLFHCACVWMFCRLWKIMPIGAMIPEVIHLIGSFQLFTGVVGQSHQASLLTEQLLPLSWMVQQWRKAVVSLGLLGQTGRSQHASTDPTLCPMYHPEKQEQHHCQESISMGLPCCPSC